MHIFPGALIGCVVWAGTVAMAEAQVFALLSGPFIVSGTALILAMIPEIRWARPMTAAPAGLLLASMVAVVGSLMMM